MLKKLLTFILVSLHLIAAPALQEWVKLPILFQHYFEHKAINHEITFAKYLVDHYNNVPHTDDDEARDNQLPFKSADHQTAHGLGSLAIPHYDQISLKAPLPTLVKLTLGYTDGQVPQLYQSKIWQPPKV